MENIRAKVPGVILRTTLITGFPTESEEDFEELIRFIKKVKFERLGCFAYSAEEDTPAAEMDGQIDEELKKHRAQIVMEEQYGIMEAFNRSMLGKQLWVAVEGFDGETYYGRSYMDAPDIDTKVFFTSSRPLKTGEYVLVTIDGVQEYDLAGKASI